MYTISEDVEDRTHSIRTLLDPCDILTHLQGKGRRQPWCQIPNYPTLKIGKINYFHNQNEIPILEKRTAKRQSVDVLMMFKTCTVFTVNVQYLLLETRFHAKSVFSTVCC